MAYKRKTKDCYAIEGNCGYGWDIECNCEDREDAKVQLKTYKENVNYPADLVQCMKLTRDNGCFWLCLDADGPRVETLEFFD